MNEVTNGVDRGKLVTGVIIVAMGVMFLLDRMNVVEFHDVIRRYWPMFFVLLGVPKLFQRGTIWAGLWLITFGVWLQMVRLHLFDLTYGNSWPLLLIALGAGMILRTFLESAIPREDENAPR